MAMPVLSELNQELTRLFAAGSRLSAGDPRLKKYVATLQKYGEKAPVFLKLAQLVEDLYECDAAQSARKLIEAESFLLSLLATQGETAPPTDAVLADTGTGTEASLGTKTGYRALAPVLEALTAAGSGRVEVVKNAFEAGMFQDPRLYRAAASALGDKYGEIADMAESQILPSIGEPVFPFLLEGYDVNGGPVDGRRLAVMHKICGEQALSLVDDAILNGNAAMRGEAVKIMACYPHYEQTLLNMLGESKTVRAEVMKALAKMDSRAGADWLMEQYAKDPEAVIEALRAGSGAYLTGELLNVARADYEAVKTVTRTKAADEAGVASILKLRKDLSVLSNKGYDAAEFLNTALWEEYLTKADGLAPRESKQVGYRSLQELALYSLFYSAGGENLIWAMFLDSRKVFSKFRKRDTKVLNAYALRVGAKKLSKDELKRYFSEEELKLLK